jgi:hypothetical protein
VQGILQAYRQNLPNIGLYGPTLFAHILKTTIDQIKPRLNEMMYNILLILTDGEIHDMPATKDLIVEASCLPFSIIIVGVGKEKFEMMIELDSDD